jgi:branched-chain amino acid transport system permease protein
MTEGVTLLAISGSQVVQGAIDAISVGSLYALFALGIALIFGIMGLINFAHGEMIMVGAYVLVLFENVPNPILVVFCIGAVVLLALVLERVAFRPVRGANPATLLVTSFAVSYLLQNVAILTLGSVPRVTNFSTVLTESFTVGGLSIPKLDVVTVAVTALLLILLVVFLGRTTMGVQMRAAAEDFPTARLLGVRANRVIAISFAISAVLAAVAAILIVSQTGAVTPDIGVSPVLFAFIATVLGGIGSLPGAVLGGYLLGALNVTLQLTLPPELRPFRDAFTFTIVFVVLVLRPQGLVVAKSTVSRV